MKYVRGHHRGKLLYKYSSDISTLLFTFSKGCIPILGCMRQLGDASEHSYIAVMISEMAENVVVFCMIAAGKQN